MEKQSIYLGLLTDVQQREGKYGTYITAWLDSIEPKPVYFHQSSLINKQESAELANGQLVFFRIEVKKDERGERKKAIDSYLAWPGQLQDYLLGLDAGICSHIRKKASQTLTTALLQAVDLLIAQSTTPHEQAKLTTLKSQLTPSSDTLERSHPTRQRSTSPPKFTVPTDGPVTSTFLHHVFTANSSEYTLKLFLLLVEGIQAISSEDSFKQALFLLNFNDQLSEGQIPNLSANFYALATRKYQLQFWLEHAVSYCDPEVLLTEFTTGSEEFRQQIMHRFPKLSELSIPSATAASPVISTYFQGIKDKLLEKLHLAQNTIQVAVAWFTNDELFAMLCQKLQQQVRVELIINNDYINSWERGLPFEDFIALGGHLYLSEHPMMMHHKFCLIDEAVLFNGSYNWTYYAEQYNEENVLFIQHSPSTITEFKAAFMELKQRLGPPTQVFEHFDQSALLGFERVNFRQYLSKDIQSRVSYTQASRPTSDVQWLATLMDKAVEIDNENNEAKQLRQSLTASAALEKHTIQSQQVVQQILDKVTVTEPTPAPIQNEVSPNVSTDTTKPIASQQAPAQAQSTPQPSVTKEQLVIASSLPQTSSNSISSSNQPQPPRPQAALAKSPVVSSAPIAKVATSLTPLKSSSPPVITSIPTTSSTPAALPISIDTSYSIPDTQRTQALFDNLQLVLAIDYSGSMEAIYKLGKIQKAVNMIFGISKGLTNSSTIDVFKFHTQAIPLPPVTISNYSTYVQDVVYKDKMGGTDIYAPINAIHDKYTVQQKSVTNAFVILITDGENEEKSNGKIKSYFTENKIQPIFWQFVGLGSKFAFLEAIAAAAANTAFFHLNDVESVSNDTLLSRLLQKFPIWFEQAKQQGIVKS
jgi:hypothetical protein